MDQSTGSSHEAVAHQRRNDIRSSNLANVAQSLEELRCGLGLLTKCGEHPSARLAIRAGEGRLWS